MPPTFALSFHADYGCRERGACCTAGWPIPIEPDRRARVEVALARGELDDVAAAPAVFVTANHVTAAEALVAVHDGVCVFHSSRGAQRCAIHRALGHTALPLACRQFPRVTVHDPRGTSVTLSHYCPTAAEHLLRPGPIVIDDTPAAFPPDGEYAGLDAAGGLPPLLTPTVLMDWEGWWALERAAVALISETTTSHEALARLDRLVSEVEQWRPGSHAFADHVRAATHTARSGTLIFLEIRSLFSPACPGQGSLLWLLEPFMQRRKDDISSPWHLMLDD